MADFDDPRPSSQPEGSTDLVVAKDNLILLDKIAVSTESSFLNRKGQERKTLIGMEEAVTIAVSSAGYQIVGDFADIPKTEITAENQVYTSKSVTDYEGYVWRTNQTLPYTPTGSDPAQAPELGKWEVIAIGELQTIARSLNALDSEVIYSTDTVTSLDNVLYIYDAPTQTTWGVPELDSTGKTIDSVVGDVLTTTGGTGSNTYTLITQEKSDLKMTLAKAVASTSIALNDSIRITDRADGIFDVVLTSLVTPNTYNIIQSAAQPTLSFVLREEDGNVYAARYSGGAVDVGPSWNFAADQAKTLGYQLIIPAGIAYSSITLDWDGTSANIVGAGVDASIINITADVMGMLFRGGYIAGIQLVGIGALATKVGMKLEQNQRHVLNRVRCNEFYDGFQFTNGNLSDFQNISARYNVRHGWYNDDLGVDSNSITVGTWDLSNNGGDGIHFENAAPPYVSQQWSGGIISCQSNGGKAFNLSGRGHDLTFYDENNGAQSTLDATCVGSQVTVLYTDTGALDNGPAGSNNLTSHRVGAAEAISNSNIESVRCVVRDRSFSGNFVLRQDRNNVLQILEEGSSSVSLVEVKSSLGDACSLRVFGRVHGAVLTNTAQGALLDPREGNSFRISSPTPVTITSITPPTPGHEFTLSFADNNITVQDNANIHLEGGVDFVGTTNDTLKILYDGVTFVRTGGSVN